MSSSLTFPRNFCGKCTWDSASSCCTDALTLLENELLGKLPTGWLRSTLNDVKGIDKSAPWRQSTVAGKSVCSMNCHGPGQAPSFPMPTADELVSLDADPAVCRQVPTRLRRAAVEIFEAHSSTVLVKAVTSAVRKDTAEEQWAAAGATRSVLNQQAHVKRELLGQQGNGGRKRRHNHEGERALQCGHSVGISGKSARCSTSVELLTRIVANGKWSVLVDGTSSQQDASSLNVVGASWRRVVLQMPRRDEMHGRTRQNGQRRLQGPVKPGKQRCSETQIERAQIDVPAASSSTQPHRGTGMAHACHVCCSIDQPRAIRAWPREPIVKTEEEQRLGRKVFRTIWAWIALRSQIPSLFS